MYDPLVTDPDTGVTSKGFGPTIWKNVDLQEGRCIAYDLVYERSGAPVRTRPLPSATVPRELLPAATPAHWDTIRRGLASAEQYASVMTTSAREGDLIGLSNAGFSLEATLTSLWSFRQAREDDWGDLLNLLQGALAHEEFERFTADQCRAIMAVIVDHLASGVTGIDDVERAVRLLREAGFDPWKGVSLPTDGV